MALNTPTNRPILHHLASRLFQPGPPKPITPGPPVTLIEATDIPDEVRHALRWLKARIVQDGYHPTQVALLARDIGPYRPFIRQIAQEMGIDLRLADGSPLGQSPVIVALLGVEYDYEYMIDQIVFYIKTICESRNVPAPNIITEFGSFTVGEVAE